MPSGVYPRPWRVPVAPLAAAVERSLFEHARSWNSLARAVYGRSGETSTLKRRLGLKLDPSRGTLALAVNRNLAARICEAAYIDPREAGL